MVPAPMPSRVASAANVSGAAIVTGTALARSVKSLRQSTKTAPGTWPSR